MFAFYDARSARFSNYDLACRESIGSTGRSLTYLWQLTLYKVIAPDKRDGTFIYQVQHRLHGDKSRFTIFITVILVKFTINALSIARSFLCYLVSACCPRYFPR